MERGGGRLLCRTGEAVREFRGLDTGDGDDILLVDVGVGKGGAVVVSAFRDSSWLLRAEVLALFPDTAVSAWPPVVSTAGVLLLIVTLTHDHANQVKSAYSHAHSFCLS